MPLYLIGDRSVLFVHIPKTGGASIERFLATQGRQYLKSGATPPGLPCPPQHLAADALAPLAPESDFAFAVVRNPYDRLISEYLFRFAGDGNRPMPHFAAWWAYARLMHKRNRYFLSNHITPQVEFVSPGTHVYRFEEGIGSILADVAARLGVEPPGTVPFVKKSPRVTFAVSRGALASIAEFYAADFEAFGYDRDPEEVLARRGVAIGRGSALRWLLSPRGVSDAIRGAAHALRR